MRKFTSVKAKDKKFLKALGKRIKKLREDQEISQDQLGYECDMSRVNISRIENGQIGTAAHRLMHIAKALNVHVKDLFNFPYDGE
jgi:transcriptional regulator with XRE-family HTH domain